MQGVDRLPRKSAVKILHDTQGPLMGRMGDVEVGHRGGDMPVPQEQLEGAKIDARLQEVRGEGVPERVNGRVG